MTRDEEMLAYGSVSDQADTVAAFLEMEGWLTYAKIVRKLAQSATGVHYRGWEIDRYRKPDGCFYAYAPSYCGITAGDTQCAPYLHELCDQIDEVIEERSK